MTTVRKISAVSLLASTMLTLAGQAAAQTTPPDELCADLTRPIYVTGSSALKSFIGVVGKLLASDGSPSTVVYQSQGSCVGVSTVFDPSPTKRVIKDVPGNYAIYYRADGSSKECGLPADGQAVTIGVSDVYAASCGFGADAAVTDYTGPIQPMTFVVPAGSKQTAISAEAAYYAFGLGGGQEDESLPWVDPSFFFVRNAGSGTQQMIAKSIGVPAGQWWGVNRGGSGAVRDQLKVIVDPVQSDKAIGILATDLADTDRANLRILAYKAHEQECAYLPDSTLTSRDKANVRDGHYDIWGPSHLFTRTSNGTPVDPGALTFLARFVTPQIPDDLLNAEIDGALVPTCAMRVSRSEEVGALSSFQPPYSCGCYFDQRTTGTTSCQSCESATDCPASEPSCNFGFCEVQ